MGVERVPQRLRRRYAALVTDEQRAYVELYPSFGRQVVAVKRSPGAVFAARGVTNNQQEVVDEQSA